MYNINSLECIELNFELVSGQYFGSISCSQKQCVFFLLGKKIMRVCKVTYNMIPELQSSVQYFSLSGSIS